MSGQFSLRRAVRAHALITGRAALAVGLLAASLLSATTLHAPAASAAAGGQATASTPAAADDLGGQPAAQPYMGWSSWSLESTNYPGVNTTGSASWLTEQHVLQQADVAGGQAQVVRVRLRQHRRRLVERLRRLRPAGRQPDDLPRRHPLHRRLRPRQGPQARPLPGGRTRPAAYGDGNTPIYGAPGCYTKNIVYPDLRRTNGWNNAYKIDFTSPCAQAYINSIADELAGWGVDFLKLDGVGPGSFQGGANHDNTPDVAAWTPGAEADRPADPVRALLVAQPQRGQHLGAVQQRLADRHRRGVLLQHARDLEQLGQGALGRRRAVDPRRGVRATGTTWTRWTSATAPWTG